MAKRSIDPVNKKGKARFTISAPTSAGDRAKSTGHFSGIAAPRVGTGKPKSTAKVTKPSRVQSGISLKKKKY